MTNLDWEKNGGLVPVIVQDSSSGRVLMLGYMNREALDKTIETGLVTFWSRGRKELWTKGETSGNYLKLKTMRHDCDADTLLVIAQPTGPACHQGTRSCFGDEPATDLEFLDDLEKLIENRKKEMPEGSYTSKLFTAGLPEILKKLGEEAVEVVVSATQSRERTVQETADLLYHLLVFLVQQEIRLADVITELERRH